MTKKQKLKLESKEKQSSHSIGRERLKVWKKFQDYWGHHPGRLKEWSEYTLKLRKEWDRELPTYLKPE